MFQSKSTSIYNFWIKHNLLSCFHTFLAIGQSSSAYLQYHRIHEVHFLKIFHLIFCQPDTVINENGCISMETFQFFYAEYLSQSDYVKFCFFSSFCTLLLLDLSSIASRHLTTPQQAFKL